ncbi:Hypothetical protein, putative [Bodo saltans]|uniref:PDZ domain-containing protein n=1 Tax=Bodo saltans TaxID=75058 RepID=A0A0S4KPV6_BODSA|nr:Hypothetical protein, putative [Bodo saltans]|eukprot:CUI15596.1 Hypothetical protein, putative [Bodo saltans]
MDANNDFSASVSSVLNSESLIRFRPATPVADLTGLVQLLQTMSLKIEQQETELIRQRDLVDSLMHEVATLRVGSDDAQLMRRDMKRVVNEVETLGSQQRMQNQRLERLRADVDDLGLEQRPSPLAASQRSQTQAQAAQAALGSPRGSEARSPQRTQSGQQFSRVGSAVKSINQQRPVVGLELVDTAHGVRVQAVKPGGPASLAGVFPGDIIVACNSIEINTRQDFLDMLEQSTIGQSQDLTLYRDNQRKMTRMYVVSGAAEAAPRSPN